MELIYEPARATTRVIAKIIKPKKKKANGMIVNVLDLVTADRQFEGHTSYARITSLPRQYYCTQGGLELLTERKNFHEVMERALLFVEETGSRMKVKEPYDLQVGDIVYFRYSDIKKYFDTHDENAHIIADPEEFIAYKRDGKIYPMKGYYLVEPYDVNEDLKKWESKGFVIPQTISKEVKNHVKCGDKIFLTDNKGLPWVYDEDFNKIYYLWADSIIAELVDGEYIAPPNILFVKVDKEGLNSKIENFVDLTAKLQTKGMIGDRYVAFFASLRGAVCIKGDDYVAIREEQVMAELGNQVTASNRFIVVKRDPIIDKTESGLYLGKPIIPDTGVVLSSVDKSLEGKHIKFNIHGISELKHNGENYLLMDGKDAIFEL